MDVVLRCIGLLICAVVATMFTIVELATVAVGSHAGWATVGVTLLELIAAAWAGAAAHGQLNTIRSEADARSVEPREADLSHGGW